jgi:hypothetical protein
MSLGAARVGVVLDVQDLRVPPLGPVDAGVFVREQTNTP